MSEATTRANEALAWLGTGLGLAKAEASCVSAHVGALSRACRALTHVFRAYHASAKSFSAFGRRVSFGASPFAKNFLDRANLQ